MSMGIEPVARTKVRPPLVFWILVAIAVSCLIVCVINYNFFEVQAWSSSCDVIKESVTRSRCK